MGGKLRKGLGLDAVKAACEGERHEQARRAADDGDLAVSQSEDGLARSKRKREKEEEREGEGMREAGLSAVVNARKSFVPPRFVRLQDEMSLFQQGRGNKGPFIW